MKKIMAYILSLLLCLSCTAALAAGRVGISMPADSIPRWVRDGNSMKALLEIAGYEVDLQYAGNDIDMQISQIETMIQNGAQALIITPCDKGNSMDAVLASAKENNIRIIAYDRLIAGTQYVDYYTTFDSYDIGAIQGNYIKDRLKLGRAAGPFHIEFAAGSVIDSNAKLFFKGAIDVLQPYIDDGKLIVASGQTEFSQVATPNWDSETARARMNDILTANYSDDVKLDACLCSNDSIALGVTAALISFGYTAKNMPIITGQDCDLPNVKNMIDGLQSMSVFKDTRVLAAQTVKMVTELLSGKIPETNASYGNGSVNIPAYNCTTSAAPTAVDASNYRELLLDSGYYTEADLAN